MATLVQVPGGLRSIVAGQDSQAFGLDGSGDMWNYKQNLHGGGWTDTQRHGIEITVGSNSSGDGDVAYLRTAANEIWRYKRVGNGSTRDARSRP